MAGSDATLTKLSREFFFNTYVGCEDIYSVAAFIKVYLFDSLYTYINFLLFVFVLLILCCVFFLFFQRWYMRLPEKLLAPLSLSELDSLSVEPAQKIREYINVRLTDKLYPLSPLPFPLLLSSPSLFSPSFLPLYSSTHKENETSSGG